MSAATLDAAIQPRFVGDHEAPLLVDPAAVGCGFLLFPKEMAGAVQSSRVHEALQTNQTKFWTAVRRHNPAVPIHLMPADQNVRPGDAVTALDKLGKYRGYSIAVDKMQMSLDGGNTQVTFYVGFAWRSSRKELIVAGPQQILPLAARATISARARKTSLHRQRLWALWGSYTALSVFVVMFLVPPFYTLITSLKSSAEISAQTGSPWLVHHPTLENFWYLITYPNFQTYYLNSVIVTVLVVVVSMVISILAAFSLARMGFWGSHALSTGVFLTYLVPPSLLFIPLFQIIGKIGLINNFWCLVILYPTLAVPFCTWIMIGYFSSIPKELDEAALIDGASYLQILWRIFIPVAMPGIIAATIFAFTVSWGAFLYPLAYLYTSNQMVLTVGIISDLIRGDVFQWGKIMAACLLASMPPIIIYAFLMDYYVAGLTAGATKG
jgi:multiple sugar transport system permease protein